jgi:hypothetical protein
MDSRYTREWIGTCPGMAVIGLFIWVAKVWTTVSVLDWGSLVQVAVIIPTFSAIDDEWRRSE